MPSLPILLLGLIVTLACGCSSSPPTRAPGLPPTPASVTRSNPGGDAADPEAAALYRLIDEPWGHRKDRFNTLRVPLADWKKWRRVRIWSQPTRATYRYGDNHYALLSILYTKTEGPSDPDSCLAEFWQKYSPLADVYGVRIGDAQILRTTQDIDGHVKPLVFKLLEGSVENVFASDDYMGAVAAYQSWPGTCLLQGFAVKSGQHRDLAHQVRKRWLAEGAPKLSWLRHITEAPEPKAR